MLDGYRDEQLDALLALLRDSLNGELSVDADQACESVHAWPTVPARLPVHALPALAVWRQRSGFVPRATGAHDQRVTLRFLYVLPPTPLERVGERWPLLTKAWDLVACTLLAGHYASHRDDAEVLRDVGFVDVDIAGASVDFATPAADADVQPQWEATITVTLRTSGDTTSLDELSLHTELHPADLPEDERPLVEEIHTQ